MRRKYLWGNPEYDELASVYCGDCGTFMGVEDEDPQQCPKCKAVAYED